MSTQRARKSICGDGRIRPSSQAQRGACLRNGNVGVSSRFPTVRTAENVSKWAEPARQAGLGGPCRNLQLILDFPVKRISIELSPPIQFRIEWADSQGMSPLLGCRPI